MRYFRKKSAKKINDLGVPHSNGVLVSFYTCNQMIDQRCGADGFGWKAIGHVCRHQRWQDLKNFYSAVDDLQMVAQRLGIKTHGDFRSGIGGRKVKGLITQNR